MDRSEAKIRFNKADKLFQVGRYEDALDELNAIEAHYPNNHRLLNAQARTLERLRRPKEALAICDRLLQEFEYDKIRGFREGLALSLRNGPPPLPPSHSQNPETPPANTAEDESMDETPSRFQIKPIRLVLLIAIIALTYLEYIPIWLGAALVVAYFLAKFLIGRAIMKLFSAPFKMKGKALAGAECIYHGHQWTEKPVYDTEDDSEDDYDDEDDGPSEPRRYVWIDVSITPQERSEGFTYWEPGELMLAPANLKLKGLDSLDACYQVEDVKILKGGVETEDEDGKYAGPQRLKLLVGVPEGQTDFTFAYYLEQFGQVRLEG